MRRETLVGPRRRLLLLPLLLMFVVAPAAPVQAQVVDGVLARWRCNEPGCSYADWAAAVVNWPAWAAYQTNARTSFANSRSVFTPGGEPLYPYMGPWADGCEVTVNSGVVLIIEWQRGTDVWRETLMGPGDSHVIQLTPPEDGAMIETVEGGGTFNVTLANCTPQPIYPAGLTVSKTDNQTLAAPGSTLEYTVTVTNGSAAPVGSVVLTEEIPAELVDPQVTPADGVYNTATGDWTQISIPPGESLSLTLTGTIDPAATGAILNTVRLRATPDSVATDTTTIAAPGSADLAISHSGPASAVAGGNLVYSTTVTNLGPSEAAGVAVSIAPETGLGLLSNDCGNAVPCPFGTLSAGQSRTLQSTYALSPGFTGATVSSTATASSSTADPANGNDVATAIASVTRAADLTVTKTGPSQVLAGQQLTFVISVTNNGPSDAQDVVVADPTPAGLVFVANAGDCTTAFPCLLGVVPAGASRTINATFAVPGDYAGTGAGALTDAAGGP